MPQFKYEAMDNTGLEVKDVIEAESKEHATMLVREKGFFVTRISLEQKLPSLRDRVMVLRDRVMVLREPEQKNLNLPETNFGFWLGLIAGLLIGLAVGFALG